MQPTGQIAPRGNARHSDDDSIPTDDYTVFARSRVGTRPQMMVCFRKCSGEVTVFAYSLLTKIRPENPDRGFPMSFNENEVRLKGENLLPLFHYLSEHRAVEIVEADRTTLMQAEGECVVPRILAVSAKLSRKRPILPLFVGRGSRFHMRLYLLQPVSNPYPFLFAAIHCTPVLPSAGEIDCFLLEPATAVFPNRNSQQASVDAEDHRQ